MAPLSKVGSTLKRSKRSFRIARSAKDYIETNFHRRFHLEDLSRHTGVGIRWLQHCFKKHFDITITDFLKTVRLDAAHRALASPSGHIADGHFRQIVMDLPLVVQDDVRLLAGAKDR